MWGHLPLSPLLYHAPPYTPLIPQAPKFFYTSISVAPSLVSTHFYLCSLTFSLRPDEVATVWRQLKHVLKILIYCFVSAPRRYHIMDTDKVRNLFS